MRTTDRLPSLLQWTLGTIFLAGIVHIVSVLSMPLFAPEDAFARFAKLGPVGSLQILPKPSPGREIIPFSDPAFATGVCQYDLALGPFRIRAGATADGFFSMSFHDRRGNVYYALTDKAATRGAIEAVVVTQAQLEAAEARDTEDEQPQELRLLSPTVEGFVMFRVLAVRPSAYLEAEDQIRSVACGLDRTAAVAHGG